MKQLSFIFLLTIMIGCTGQNVKEDNIPVALGNDSAMVANGYEVVEL